MSQHVQTKVVDQVLTSQTLEESKEQRLLSIQDWVAFAEKKGLTIKDIGEMKKGDKKKVLILDRNAFDIALADKNVKKGRNSPLVFFRHNQGVYTHEKALQGSLLFEDEDDNIKKFEFHLDLPHKRMWYPLEQGYIPSRAQDGPYSKPQHWTRFPDSTLVGWRGAMIDWSLVASFPDILID
jgi:hypothetical protein